MKRGVKTIIASVLLGSVGIIVIPLAILWPLFSGEPEDFQFKMPGGGSIQAEKPGRYYLWDVYKTVYEGERISNPLGLTGSYKVEIKDGNGDLLDFHYSENYTVTYGSRSKKSLGYVETTEPTELHFQVSGDDTGRVLSFSRSNMVKVLGSLAIGIGVAMLTGLIAIGLFIWGLVKLVKASKESPPPFPHH